ncbi:hypothetical protein ACFQX6_55455 [Streptosporangium lutulentum]
MDISDAYQHCEQVVRKKARNFSYGLRLLPPPSAARSAPSTRSHGGSTTSPTGTNRPSDA